MKEIMSRESVLKSGSDDDVIHAAAAMNNSFQTQNGAPIR